MTALCHTCKFWTRHAHDRIVQVGTCEASIMPIDGYTPDRTPHSRMTCGPNYGCVLHQPKDDNDSQT